MIFRKKRRMRCDLDGDSGRRESKCILDGDYLSRLYNWIMAGGDITMYTKYDRYLSTSASCGKGRGASGGSCKPRARVK